MPETDQTDQTDEGRRHDDVARLTYEEAREELVETVRALETGGTTLEESLALWERGEVLARRCQEWLDGARRRLDEVVATTGADATGDDTAE